MAPNMHIPGLGGASIMGAPPSPGRRIVPKSSIAPHSNSWVPGVSATFNETPLVQSPTRGDPLTAHFNIEQRALVRRLRAEKISLRDIAKQIGWRTHEVGEDLVLCNRGREATSMWNLRVIFAAGHPVDAMAPMVGVRRPWPHLRGLGSRTFQRLDCGVLTSRASLFRGTRTSSLLRHTPS